MTCRPTSRRLTPGSGPLRTSPCGLGASLGVQTAPSLGAERRQESHCRMRTTGPPGEREVSLANRLQLSRAHATGRPEALLSFPKQGTIQGTWRSVIRKKHEVRGVPDWLLSNNLPTFPGAQLPPQAAKGIITWHPWPLGLAFSLQCSRFDAGCLSRQSMRNVYSLIAPTNAAEGKQPRFSLCFYFEKNGYQFFFRVVSSLQSLYTFHRVDCLLFKKLYLSLVDPAGRRHTTHSSPNKQGCSLFNLSMQSILPEIF